MSYYNYNGDYQPDGWGRPPWELGGGRSPWRGPECGCNRFPWECCWERSPCDCCHHGHNENDERPSTVAWLGATGVQTVAAAGGQVAFSLSAPTALPSWATFVSPNTLQISKAGTFVVTYTFLAGVNDVTLALFLNNNEVSNSRFSSNGGNEPVIGQTVLVVVPADLPAALTLRNVDPLIPAITAAGALPNTITASLNVVKLF